MWVVALSIPFVYGFNFFDNHTLSFLGTNYELGPKLLLEIPDKISGSIMHPNFNKINTIEFWTTVLSILMITSIESLAIAKAVDKLDPYKRKTDLNKELTGIGLSTIAAGMIGGLPIIAVIIRSTVNIHNGAKTKWSNLYQGIFLFLFIVVLSPVMRQVPLCAFAILLVYTGFKLASPTVFKQVYSKGSEQLIFFLATMILTLYTNLLIGLLGGLVLVLISHMLLARVSVPRFFKMVFSSGSNLVSNSENDYYLKIKGVANFLSVFNINNLVSKIPSGADVKIDLSQTRLVGMTYMDFLVDFLKAQKETGGNVVIAGLDSHVSTSPYNRALKISLNNNIEKLSPRQKRLQDLANENDYEYKTKVDWNTSYLKKFHFFEIRPIERKTNCLRGFFSEFNVEWEISDVTFNDGAAFSSETFNTTVMFLKINKNIPVFAMEKEGIIEKIFDRVIAFTGHKDIDFEMYPDFSKKFLVTGNDESKIRAFFTDSLINFFENTQIYHLESNGEGLIIFDKIKLARTDETIALINYSKQLIRLLK